VLCCAVARSVPGVSLRGALVHSDPPVRLQRIGAQGEGFAASWTRHRAGGHPFHLFAITQDGAEEDGALTVLLAEERLSDGRERSGVRKHSHALQHARELRSASSSAPHPPAPGFDSKGSGSDSDSGAAAGVEPVVCEPFEQLTFAIHDNLPMFDPVLRNVIVDYAGDSPDSPAAAQAGMHSAAAAHRPAADRLAAAAASAFAAGASARSSTGSAPPVTLTCAGTPSPRFPSVCCAYL
jgi:hypothetical protein